MKVRDMIEMDMDIDVYDDVCEELAICFCCPVKLTAEGEKHFAEVLDYNVETVQDDDIVGHAIILIDGDDGDYWKNSFLPPQDTALKRTTTAGSVL